MSEEQVNEIEISMQKAKEDVSLMQSIDKLGHNPDFIDVIIKGYFETEACRLVMIKSELSMQTPEIQESIIKSIDAIGSLRQYLLARISEGHMAEKAIADDEETLDNMREEDL